MSFWTNPVKRRVSDKAWGTSPATSCLRPWFFVEKFQISVFAWNIDLLCNNWLRRGCATRLPCLTSQAVTGKGSNHCLIVPFIQHTDQWNNTDISILYESIRFLSRLHIHSSIYNASAANILATFCSCYLHKDTWQIYFSLPCLGNRVKPAVLSPNCLAALIP